MSPTYCHTQRSGGIETRLAKSVRSTEAGRANFELWSRSGSSSQSVEARSADIHIGNAGTVLDIRRISPMSKAARPVLTRSLASSKVSIRQAHRPPWKRSAIWRRECARRWPESSMRATRFPFSFAYSAVHIAGRRAGSIPTPRGIGACSSTSKSASRAHTAKFQATGDRDTRMASSINCYAQE